MDDSVDESEYEGIHTGIVVRTFPTDSKGVPFGFIEDDDPNVGDVFFRNFTGRYGEGDKLEYRLRPTKRHPVAFDIHPL
jgi:hypothetical protein